MVMQITLVIVGIVWNLAAWYLTLRRLVQRQRSLQEPQPQQARIQESTPTTTRIVQIQDPGDSYEVEDNNKSNASAIQLAPDTGDDNYNQIALAVFTDNAATATIKAKVYYRLIPNGTTVTA